jgi:hypothetical protein
MNARYKEQNFWINFSLLIIPGITPNVFFFNNNNNNNNNNADMIM